MPLEDYKKKRDFSRTPEPAGEARAPGGNSYCIQKHAASRLHYDFRLEHDGVLLSRAVPKDPSFNPREKRLAMHVERPPRSVTMSYVVQYGSAWCMMLQCESRRSRCARALASPLRSRAV